MSCEVPLLDVDDQRGVLPELFQAVIVARLRREEVNYDAPIIEDDPAGAGGAFHVQGVHICCFQAFPNSIEDGFDLSLAFAGADDEVVGDQGHGPDVQQHNIRTLLVSDGIHHRMSQVCLIQAAFLPSSHCD